MDVIQLARQLGEAIQEDERFVNFQLAQQQAEADAPLQEMLVNYATQREAMGKEMRDSGADAAKIEEMNAQLGRIYAEIIQNERMQIVLSAKEELSKLTGFISQIVEGSAQGQDPATIEYRQVHGGCGGGCSGRSGCS